MKIEIQKKKLRGEDEFRKLSIRLPRELYDHLNEVADEANMTRNELVNILLEEGIRSVIIKE